MNLTHTLATILFGPGRIRGARQKVRRALACMARQGGDAAARRARLVALGRQWFRENSELERAGVSLAVNDATRRTYAALLELRRNPAALIATARAGDARARRWLAHLYVSRGAGEAPAAVRELFSQVFRDGDHRSTRTPPSPPRRSARLEFQATPGLDGSETDPAPAALDLGNHLLLGIYENFVALESRRRRFARSVRAALGPEAARRLGAGRLGPLALFAQRRGTTVEAIARRLRRARAARQTLLREARSTSLAR